EASADALWKKIQAGMTWETATDAFEFRDTEILTLYYRDRHPAEFKVVMREHAWKEREAEVKKDEAISWESFARAAGPEKAQAAAAAIEAWWKKSYRVGISWEELGQSPADDAVKAMFEWADRGLVSYLFSRHAEESKLMTGEDTWKKVKNEVAPLRLIVLGRVEGETVTLGAVLHRGLGDCSEVRVAPGGRAVAFVRDVVLERSGSNRLMVATLNQASALEAASGVSPFFDWTADGRALAFVQAASESGKGDLPQLGALIVRQVLGDDGKLALEAAPKALAGCLLSGQVRVRCLRDGRILFNTAEISLPMAQADGGTVQEQLFAIDPARQSTLVRLVPRNVERNVPKSLTYFEVSPDGQRVVFGSTQGEVCVLTLASGEVEKVQGDGSDDLSGAPQWRSAEEFSYVRRNPEKDGVKPPHACDLVLRRGDKETALSLGWPADLLKVK
ncbi:MAG: hypothetical protein ABIO94_00755, partial [Opitutaceae bacterium]